MAEATQPQRAVIRSNPQAWEPDLEDRGDGSWGSGQSQAMKTQKVTAEERRATGFQ